MRIVTFYTKEYVGEIDPWIASVKKTGLPYFLGTKESQGSWRANVGMKPQFMLDCLEKFDEPLLWVDMDGRIVGDLHDLYHAPEKYDFGAWFIPWDQMNPCDRPGGAKTKNDGISSGTMFWNNTEKAKEMLSMWCLKEHGQHKYGQIVLGEVFHYWRPRQLRTWRMPQAWFKVFDKPWKRGENGPIIIEHFQASRRLRRTIK